MASNTSVRLCSSPTRRWRLHPLSWSLGWTLDSLDQGKAAEGTFLSFRAQALGRPGSFCFLLIGTRSPCWEEAQGDPHGGIQLSGPKTRRSFQPRARKSLPAVEINTVALAPPAQLSLPLPRPRGRARRSPEQMAESRADKEMCARLSNL